MSVVKKFVNECNNEITIDIHNTEEKNGEISLLSVSLIGPNSQSENIITREEAIELHAALGKFLFMNN